MIFESREAAGELLAKRLLKLKFNPKNSQVVVIPRGGVVIGRVIARALSIPLACIIIKKLGAPGEPELAIGATASFGKPVLDRWLIRDLKVSADYLREEVRNKKKEARVREKFLGVSFNPGDFTDKNIILVDDGMATGQTIKAAAVVLKSISPTSLILAVPCASTHALNLVRQYFDQVIILEVSDEFMAVGQFYRDFRPVSDSEVKQLLAIRG